MVGWFATDPKVHQAALWQEGHLIDLNTQIATDAGWMLSEVDGINEAGQIVGVGRYRGQDRAFLLQPGVRPGLPNTGGGGMARPGLPAWVAPTLAATLGTSLLLRRRGRPTSRAGR